MRDGIVGARWGALMGALLSCWVMILVIAGNSLVFTSRTGDRFHAGAIVAIYLGAGTFIGAFLGVLKPIMRWKIGAAILGVIASAPLFAAVMLARQNFSDWTHVETLTVIIGALAFGAPGGMIVRFFVEALQQGNQRQ